jgi:uncharacterized protein YjbJ (UPF0337 family)
MSEMKDRAEGKGSELKGKAKEVAGRGMGDPGLRAEGESDQTKGKAQGFLGRAKGWLARR